MTSQGVSIAIQLASTVVLARLLSPEDFGTMAMVLAVTAFAGLFRDLGLSSAAIQKRSLSHEEQSTLFWINVAMGTALTVLLSAAAPLVVWFYGEPQLFWVTVALSASFLIGSLGTQHSAMLVRHMQFGRKGIATIAGALVTLGVAMALALQGFSYWALVWGNLAGAVCTTSLLFALSPFRPGKPSRLADVRDLLGFGAHVTAFDFVNYFHRNLDNLLIGKYWGAGALGIYSKAYSLLLLPINAVRNPINAVSFPAMSQLQDHPEEFRAYSRRVTGTIAFFSMPLVAFLGVSAKLLIPFLLGPGWDETVDIFSILAVAAFFQPVSSMRGQVMLSMGRADRYFRFGLANALIVSIAFAIGVFFGAKGIAFSYAAASTLILYPSIAYAFKGSPLHIRDFFVPLLRPASASVLSSVILVLSTGQEDVPSTSGRLHNLVLGTSIFAISYVAFSILSRGGRRDLATTLRLVGLIPAS